MKKVPEKFKGCGIRVQCLKCRAEITDKCLLKKKSLATCGNAEKHKYKLVVHISGTSCGKKTRLTNAETFEEALTELAQFKLETSENLKTQQQIKVAENTRVLPLVDNLTATNTTTTGELRAETQPILVHSETLPDQPILVQNTIQVLQISPSVTDAPKLEGKKYLLAEYSAMYLDFISGVNVPIHLLRVFTNDHIKETKRVLLRFCKSLEMAEYDLSIIDLASIGQNEIGIFCKYILEVIKTSYNKHCAIMKAFYNWCINIQDCELKNPFDKMTLSVSVKKEKTAISSVEFNNLIAAINVENGEAVLKDGKKVNHYHSWLPIAFRLALETGLRGEEIVNLKFNKIIELHKGILAFKLVNLKVWRIKTNSDQREIDKYVKYVPITASLRKLLLECGYEQNVGADKFIIPFPTNFRLSYVQDVISRSFSHYIKLVTDRKIEYKDLRKTYITAMTMALGTDAKLFTGHSDDAVIQKHYLADAVLMGNLGNLNIFDNCA